MFVIQGQMEFKELREHDDMVDLRVPHPIRYKS